MLNLFKYLIVLINILKLFIIFAKLIKQIKDNNNMNKFFKQLHGVTMIKADTDIDFGGSAAASTKEEKISDINNEEEVKDINEPNNQPNGEPKEPESNEQSEVAELNPGDSLEYDGNTYTVNDAGDLVDKDGKVFKAKAEINNWLKEQEVEDNNLEDNQLDIAAIQKEIGIDITDENGNAVEFTSDAKGIASYVKSVIDIKSNDIAEGAVNSYLNSNPIIQQFANYLAVNGTAEGFGELPDRSGIEIDKDNVDQQVAIIKQAAHEFGNKMVTDAYIEFLKANGGLYDEAQKQLDALVEADEERNNVYAQRAKEIEQENLAAEQQMIADINSIIDTKTIGGYTLPESFVREIDGKKVTLTLNDFKKYVTVPAYKDQEGNTYTGYQKDLDMLSPKQNYERELLAAYLMFSGGSYEDLVKMAVNKEQVKTLKIKSKQATEVKGVKINRKPSTKASNDDIILK